MFSRIQAFLCGDHNWVTHPVAWDDPVLHVVKVYPANIDS
jgi:hypothetical protein